MNLAAGVEAFRSATDRREAREAASCLARHAVQLGADETVTAVRGLVEAGIGWRADAFGALLYVLDQADVRAALAGFDGLVRNTIVDPDSETRSTACLLLGRISTEPGLDLELLRLVADREDDELAWASAAEAALRLGGTGAAALLADESAVIRHRIARSLLYPQPIADPDLSARAHQVLAQLPVPQTRWPAEEI